MIRVRCQLAFVACRLDKHWDCQCLAGLFQVGAKAEEGPGAVVVPRAPHGHYRPAMDERHVTLKPGYRGNEASYVLVCIVHKG